MPVIDSDAHVVETEHTWDFIPQEGQKYRPVIVAPHGEEGRQYWMVDGKIRGLARIYEIPDFAVFVRGVDPTAIAGVTLAGLNTPIRIGRVTSSFFPAPNFTSVALNLASGSK